MILNSEAGRNSSSPEQWHSFCIDQTLLPSFVFILFISLPSLVNKTSSGKSNSHGSRDSFDDKAINWSHGFQSCPDNSMTAFPSSLTLKDFTPNSCKISFSFYNKAFQPGRPTSEGTYLTGKEKTR